MDKPADELMGLDRELGLYPADERREKYAAAIANSDNTGPDEFAPARAHLLAADAAMAVADEEREEERSEFAERVQQRDFQREEDAGRIASLRAEHARLQRTVRDLEGLINLQDQEKEDQRKALARLHAELADERADSRAVISRLTLEKNNANEDNVRLRAELEKAHADFLSVEQSADQEIARVRAVVDQYPEHPWYHGPSIRTALDGTDG